MLGGRLGMSKENGLAEKDSRLSQNPTPDMPQCGPGKLTDTLQNNQRLCQLWRKQEQVTRDSGRPQRALFLKQRNSKDAGKAGVSS